MLYAHRDKTIWPLGLMTLIATVLLGLSMGVVAAPLLIGLPLLVYLATGWPRMPKPRMFLHLLLGLPFVVWFRYGVQNVTFQHYLPIALLFVMGFYMLALAGHHLLSLRAGGSRDHALGCTVLALGVAGAGRRDHWDWIYIPLVLVFIVLLLIHLRLDLVRRHPQRRAAWVWPRYAAAVLVLVSVVSVMEWVIVPKVPEVSRRLMEKLVQTHQRDQLGPSRTARLGSLSEIWGHAAAREQPMLHVYAERLADPYLRGAAYDKYGDQRGTWSIISEVENLKPLNDVTHLGRNIFNIYENQPSGDVMAVVYPQPEVAGSFYLPLGVHEIASYTDQALTGRAQTIRPQGEGAAGGYMLYTPQVVGPGEPPTPADLEVPEEVQPGLAPFVENALPPDMPTPAKLRRLEAWFVEHGFTYKIGIKIEEDWLFPPFFIERAPDPVLQFMAIKAGHCEYFASAAVLMLRMAGVPARYVTGFVVDEPGVGGRWWIARRRHAHAWVEAWVPGQGWVRVEPTPPDGRPQVTPPLSAGQRWREWLAAQWDRVKQLTLYGGLTGLLGTLWDYVMSLPQKVPVWAWVALISLGLAWIFRHGLASMFRRRREDPASERIKALRRNLAAVERKLARYGLAREPGTTASIYHRRVRAAPSLPPELRAQVLPMLDEYIRERFRRE